MEALIELRGLMSRLSNKLAELTAYVTELNKILNGTAASLGQRDKIASIHALRSRIMKEVQDEQTAEYEAEGHFNRSKTITGIASFSLGSFVGAALNQKNPFFLGARMFNKELDKKAPFGRVLFAIREKAAFDDISAVSISRLAREREVTESEIILSLRAKYLLLLPPEKCYQVLDLLEKELKKGIDLDLRKAFVKFAKPRIPQKKSGIRLLETN